jgi:hypothetical protein
LIQVQSHHTDAPLDAPDHFFFIQFHAAAFNVFFVPQSLQESAGSATQVKHSGARSYQVDDDVESYFELMERSSYLTGFSAHR